MALRRWRSWNERCTCLTGLARRMKSVRGSISRSTTFVMSCHLDCRTVRLRPKSQLAEMMPHCDQRMFGKLKPRATPVKWITNPLDPSVFL